MKNIDLNKEETQLLKSVEVSEFKSVLTDKRQAELVAIAKNTVRKDKRINIRITDRSLKAAQLKATEEGIPYQTLVSSIMHKYILGSLNDGSVNKKTSQISLPLIADLGDKCL